MTSDNALLSLSIIVPILNEEKQLPDFLSHLQEWKNKGHEVLLVDGGSIDGSIALAHRAGFSVISSVTGRASQMNLGARASKGSVLLFLHADTYLPPAADALLFAGLACGNYLWGRFDVSLTGRVFMLKIIAWLINKRSQFTGIATGDQAIFVTRKAFESVAGFPLLPLMEDVALSRKLKQLSAPYRIKRKVVTSGRRWECRGIWRTIFLMWRLRFAYWRGVPAEELAKLYK